jgi:integrase
LADCRYLKKRREGWYFQLAVPSKLREAYGKATITASLKTRDLTVAQARRWAKYVTAQEEFAKLESNPAAEALPPEDLLNIDDFARAYYRETLKVMDAETRKGIRLWDNPELDRGWEEACHGYLIETDFKPVAEALATYCARHEIGPGSQHYHAVGDALLSARMYAFKGRKLALEGKPSDEPATFLLHRPVDVVTLKPLHSTGRGGPIFAEVAARFIAEKQRDPAFALTAQTRGQYEAAFRLFGQWAKQPRLEDIDRSKANAFLDAISSLDPHWGRGPGVKAMGFHEIAKRFGGHKLGLSAKTVNRYAMALSMVWQYAADRDGYQSANPWTRQSRPTTKRRGSSELDKRGFTAVEIGKLLERRPSVAPRGHDVAVALPWLTLIGAYSAMRLNEICELEVEDVKETAGVWYFDLTASKTDAGVRIVPVHSKILAAGFTDYCKTAGRGLLWPGLKPAGPDQKRSWYVSKRFTEYRRGLRLIDIDKVTGRDRLDFHSLRRSAITALKHAGIPEHEVAELVGHDHPRITYGGYADRGRLERLKAVVDTIRYD